MNRKRNREGTGEGKKMRELGLLLLVLNEKLDV